MKTIKNLLWALLPIFALTFVVGCEKGPNDEPDGPIVKKDSKITITSTTPVNASLAGGEYTLIYQITDLNGGANPHSGEKITAEAAEGWVNNFNYAISGILSFKVDANPGTTTRQCLVTIKYRYAEDVTFLVKQGAKTDASFTLENVTPTMFDYTVDVIPSNKTMPYIVMSADPVYIANYGLVEGEDFYNDDIDYFTWVGSFYGESAADVMNARCKIGDQRGVNIPGAASGVPYTFYCYYFDPNTGALTSDVTLFEITTLKPEKNGASFDAEYTVDGCVVSADILTSYDGAYYFDMLNGIMVDLYLEQFDFLETPADVAEFYWSMAVNDMRENGGMSGSDIVSYYNCQGLYEDGTPRSHYDFELLANHTYYLFCFAMDENGLCCSTPMIKKIETGSVPMSDNVITPSVSNITATTAHISFTTTNDDYYIAGWEKASDWATYGNTDAERQQYLLENLSYEFISGDYSQNIIGLEEGVEYVLYAFGSRGGVATTEQIWTCKFTTKSGLGAATIEIVDNGYYAASDLAELPGWEFMGGDYYSGLFVLPVEFKITGEWQSFFATCWDWTGRYDEYNDEQYRDNLVWSINEYGTMSPDKTYTLLNNDSDYTYVAMIIDSEGQYSNVAKLKVHTSYDGAKTDANEFAEWWNGNSGAELQSLVIDSEPKTLFRAKNVANKLSKEGYEVKSVKMDIE